jgi:hypothetical protein
MTSKKLKVENWPIEKLIETVTHNHTASGNPIANDDRLKELEAKRRMLMQSTEIVIDAKKDEE